MVLGLKTETLDSDFDSKNSFEPRKMMFMDLDWKTVKSASLILWLAAQVIDQVDFENSQLGCNLWLQVFGKWFWAMEGKEFEKWKFDEK